MQPCAQEQSQKPPSCSRVLAGEHDTHLPQQSSVARGRMPRTQSPSHTQASHNPRRSYVVACTASVHLFQPGCVLQHAVANVLCSQASKGYCVLLHLRCNLRPKHGLVQTSTFARATSLLHSQRQLMTTRPCQGRRHTDALASSTGQASQESYLYK